MFPININYNPVGLLAAAAVQAGASNRPDPGLGLVLQDIVQRRQLGAQQDAARANMLQQASQMQQERQQGSPTSQLYFRGNGLSPMASSIKLAKQTTRSALLNNENLPPEQQDRLTKMENDEGISLNDYEKIVRDTASGQKYTNAEKVATQRLADTEQEHKARAARSELRSQLQAQRGKIDTAKQAYINAVTIPGVPHKKAAIRNPELEALLDAPPEQVVQAMSTNPALQTPSARQALLAYRRAAADYLELTHKLGGETPAAATPQATGTATIMPNGTMPAPEAAGVRLTGAPQANRSLQTRYPVGSSLSMGDKTYTVVGYDHDGMPLLQ